MPQEDQVLRRILKVNIEKNFWLLQKQGQEKERKNHRSIRMPKTSQTYGKIRLGCWLESYHREVAA